MPPGYWFIKPAVADVAVIVIDDRRLWVSDVPVVVGNDRRCWV
jgi:hypothetical protein